MVQLTRQAKKAPIGVKAISILFYLFMVLQLAFGIILIYVSGSAPENVKAVLPYISALLKAMGIAAILGAVLMFFIARGLWKLQRWARNAGIIVAVIGTAYSAYEVSRGWNLGLIFVLLIYAAIIGYLFFNKKAKESFEE